MINDVSLEELFPRIYTLAINKTGVVGKFGVWSGNQWCWNIATRRLILGWEETIWA